MEIKNTKIKVKDETENRKVQERLFSFGCYWQKNQKEVKYLDAEALYINEYLEITYTSNADTYFNNHKNKEITVAQLFSGKVPIETHIVAWDIKGCGDPIILCFSEDDAKERVKELFQKSDVVKESIRVYEIKSITTPTQNITYRKKVVR